MTWLRSIGLVLVLAGCAAQAGFEGEESSDEAVLGGKADGWAVSDARLGAFANVQERTVTFRVFSERATRIEVWIYAAPVGGEAIATEVLQRDDSHVWSAQLDLDALDALAGGGALYYGYRAWGPNWAHVQSWRPGTLEGFSEDVDRRGNRFNPNKLLLDPYALEISHDPIAPEHVAQGIDARIYASGDGNRQLDSGPWAPKGVILEVRRADLGSRPDHPLREDVIYEVHVRGLTRNDPSIPEELRGTYAGAALKAAYLRELGVTAIELLPIQETQNDTNDLHMSTSGDNYWGYATLAFFAPDRRYAADQSPGGPTRELQEMVRAFHAEGIKVFVDVVYNHTGEGGIWDAGVGNTASLLSWRGLDNHSYYQDVHGNYDPNDPTVVVDHRNYWDNNGVAGNFRTAHRAVRDQIVDSLRYWHETLGVDGFRFDLASVLGNECGHGCFEFDKLNPENPLNRAVRELPARPEDGGRGVDLIAEPWAIGAGTYQVGNFPAGWAEWNGVYRDTIRKDQNQLGIERVTPGQLATRIAGSSDMFGDDGRRPWHSVNFLVAHDGLTLRDLYSCNGKDNGQPWPYGPSDGGESNNHSWDHGGDPAAQRQAARTGLALLMLSAGVPMITGGDEMLRSQRCNNNAYNLDSEGNWLDWSGLDRESAFHQFTQRLIAFRRAHAAVRPAFFYEGSDRDDDGVKDVTWFRDDGREADGGYMDSPERHFLAWRLDGDELGDEAASIYVAYNGWSGRVTATLPAPSAGRRWHRVADTAAWMESAANMHPQGVDDPIEARYDLAPGSVLLLVER